MVPAAPDFAGGAPSQSLWAWLATVSIGLALLVCGAVLYLVPLRTLRAVFTEEGVRQPRLRGWATIRWAEMSRVERPNSLVLVLRSPTTVIELNLVLFADSRAVLDEITRRVPPTLV